MIAGQGLPGTVLPVELEVEVRMPWHLTRGSPAILGA
jgi:hypothetical protein